MRKIQELLKKTSKILKTLWLLFPSLVFLILVWQCFWVLPQGKDIIISMLEKKYVAGLFLVALTFYVFITWYTGRILVYRKKELSHILYQHYRNQADKPEASQKDVAFYLQIVFNMPRLFGYLIFVFIWIAFLRLVPLPELGFTSRISSGWAYGLLGINIIVYIGLYRVARLIRKRTIEQPVGHYTSAAEQKKRKNLLFASYFVLLVLLIGANIIWHNAWLLLLSIVVLQLIFPFIVVIRRTHSDLGALPLMEGKNYSDWLRKENARPSILHWILYHANIPFVEKKFFLWFNIISLIGVGFYLLTIFYFPFSVWLGSFSFVLLAFGVLVGFLSIISIVSVANDINLHIFIFLLAIVVGSIPGFEPHNVQLTNYKDPNAKPFNARPDLKSYFSQWLAVRKNAIDSSAEYPVYFVLADGGASRSGYWTASALSKLQDSTKGKFGDHLFCLSGASGGSVGNGSFFALMHQQKIGAQVGNYSLESRNYLQEDFLTYTIGRMLGPDFVRFILPIWFIDDRAAALEHAMENGGTGTYRLANKMAGELSELIPFQQNNKDIPILFVNVTRMQDGRPGLISNIKLDEASFGKRIDVLATLDTGKNMKLSTAVIMGARFPYVSPAGRINNSYYVDGGYFDNSGAGAVHEMIIQLNRIVNDSTAGNKQHALSKLRFTVIHIMNSPEGEPIIEKVHPLKNDLMAPLLTLVGSYSTQTTVNNLRLVKYIEDINKTRNRYIKINLYEQYGREDFPMNWTISQHYRRKMDVRLEQNKGVKRVLEDVMR
jgi:predicted acylesterase/phospholipase RssA